MWKFNAKRLVYMVDEGQIFYRKKISKLIVSSSSEKMIGSLSKDDGNGNDDARKQ